MIYLVLGVFALSCTTFYLTVREYNRTFERERKQWSDERQILLNRLANPQKEYIPHRTLTKQEVKAQTERIAQIKEENEQFGLVGKIID